MRATLNRPPPEQLVLYEKDPKTKIATITLNRPDALNAPTIAARLRFADLVHRLVVGAVHAQFRGAEDVFERRPRLGRVDLVREPADERRANARGLEELRDEQQVILLGVHRFAPQHPSRTCRRPRRCSTIAAA